MEKKKMERSKKEALIVDMKKVEKNISLLEEGARYKEMVVYLFQAFVDLVDQNLGIGHPESQTYREFAMELVKKIKIDVSLIYPFVSLYEEIRYSNHPINKAMYTEARKLFDNLSKYLKSLPRVK
ncbi:MAG: DUF4129 domain-containing protein [Candidatus Lokiarchaeota archaeon]|nr:DUF4129 domain-containing protein [Candidatus Lokiarchaeota archaeon]